jgi:hypothetical protein
VVPFDGDGERAAKVCDGTTPRTADDIDVQRRGRAWTP